MKSQSIILVLVLYTIRVHSLISIYTVYCKVKTERGIRRMKRIKSSWRLAYFMWVIRFQNLSRPFKDLPSPVSSNSVGSSEMSRDEILFEPMSLFL